MKPHSVGERQPFLYFGGSIVDDGGSEKLVWYGLEVETLSPLNSSDSPRRNKKQRRFMASQEENPQESCRVVLDPVLEMTYGCSGCGTIIGEDIYWFGDNGKLDSMDLFKHACNDTNPLSWDILASNIDSFTRDTLFAVIPVARKLYVFFSGTNTSKPPNCPGLNMGAIYDLDSRTWENLICDISTPIAIGPYQATYVVFSEKTNEILFYSLHESSILFFNLTTGKWRNQNHGSLALRNSQSRHVGLEDCNFITLSRATRSPAVLSDYTLYWFTSDLCLYGYDISCTRWFRSPFLGDQLPPLAPFNPINGSCDNDIFTFLVDLHKGKFMVLISDGLGRMTVARLSVSRIEDSFSVTVESFIPLAVHRTLAPIAEMSMVRNTGSSSMHEPVRSARET